MPLCRACGDDHGNAPDCPRTRAPVTTGPCGTGVDRWDVERLLGSGGFGAVYVARHSVLGTRVAMKLLRPSHAQSNEVVQRFVREARVAASIGSPHIVRVTDFGVTSDGASFLVMELLEGGDLDSLLEKEGTLAPARAVEIARQMLAGLAAAHRAGVIHRDLKPANIFLAQEGGREVVKLVDFGISKSLQPGEETITRTGVVVGTPAYMAPEQLRGAPIDARTDVYASSVVLYQMLTARKPHEAPTFEQLVLRVCTSDPTPLRTVAPDVDPALAAVVERGLSRDPASRWPSADALNEALARLPAMSLQRTRAQPFAQTAFAAATPIPAASSPFGPPATPTPGVAPWASAAQPAPLSVQPLAPPFTPPTLPSYRAPGPTPPPRTSGGLGARTLVLGCMALLLGVVTMGAIAFVTSKLLGTTRAEVPTAPPPSVIAPPPLAALAPTGPKPPATPDPDSDFPSVAIGPAIAPVAPTMPAHGTHVAVDEPEVVSQDLDTAILRRTVRDAQRDFDDCRTDTATRVQAQIMFAFGHVTMAHAGNDNTGDHSVAECIAHRFAEHYPRGLTEGDGIVNLWATVPAR